MGRTLRPAQPGRTVYDCRASPSRTIDPPNRCSSGSRAIDNLSRAEAQPRHGGRLQTELRPRAGRAPGAGQGSRLDRNAELRELVLDRFGSAGRPSRWPAGWQAARPPRPISYESIYRFIYAQIGRTNDGTWRHYLPRAKLETDAPPASVGARATTSSKRRVSIDFAAPRRRAPHTPSDIGKPTSCCSLPRARPSSSRTNATPVVTLSGKATQQGRATAAEPSSPGSERSNRGWRKSVTFDNGTEFAQHHGLHDHSASRPSSATRTPLGRRAASKTPSAACDGACPERQTSPPSTKTFLDALHRRLQQHAAKMPRLQNAG